MKINIFKLIFMVLAIYAPPHVPQSLEEMLNDPDILVRREAIGIIIDENLREYIPVLVDLIFEQSEPLMIKNFMEVLAFLNYDEIGEIAYQFIEMADEFDKMFPKADPLEMKVVATEVLFNIADYSTVNYVFELAERDYPFDQQSGLITMSMLGRIINEVPEYEEIAKEILLETLNNSPNVKVRSIAMSAVYEKYAAELVETYVYVSESDDDWAMRSAGMVLLHKINYSQLNALLKERITVDEQPGTRRWIAHDLLNWFGEPSDLKYLQDYLPHETDPTAELGISIEISTFIPPKPEGLSYNELFLRLISYTNEMFEYDWIQNEETKEYYSQMLTIVYESIENTGEIGEACLIIDERILQQVEQDLQEEIITVEAYKFLYHYTIYIKEEIEKEFGLCP